MDSLALRRLLAFAVDYVLLAVYVVALAGFTLAAQRVLGLSSGLPTTLRERLVGHGIAFVTLTLPVVLYFALTEASARQGTLGKRALGLRVVAGEGGRVTLGRALLRAAAKFAPWEVAHTSLWHTAGWPAAASPTPLNWFGYLLPLLVAAWYAVSLFRGSGRTPYDRLAGTRIIRARTAGGAGSEGPALV